MATDEEYLDSLLKSMTESEQPTRNMEEVMKSMNMEAEIEEEFSLDTSDLADMLDKIEENEGLQSMIEEIRDEASSVSYADSVEMPIFQEAEDNSLLDSSVHKIIEESSIELNEKPFMELNEETWAELSKEPSIALNEDPSTELNQELLTEDIVNEVFSVESDNDTLSAASNEMADEDFIRKLLEQQESLEQENLSSQNDELFFAALNSEDNADINSNDNIDENMDIDLMNLLSGESSDGSAVDFTASELQELEHLDVTELIDNMEEMQDDLLEINELLKKADNNEYVDTDNADMMALLGAMQDAEISEDNIFWGNEEGEEGVDIGFPEGLLGSDIEEHTKSKKNSDKESKKGLFAKKGKKSKGKKAKEHDIEADANANVMEQPSEKKSGRLAQFFTYLTREEEEADENAQILNELEMEDAQNSKKNKKKKDKSDKKKSGKGSQKDKSAAKADKAAKEAKKQEKKAEKERKKQEKKLNQPKEPYKKVLSKKGTIVLVAFCASIIAAVFALSTFLPDYVDKRDAREAFLDGDYETVYKLLYGKRLDENDTLIYERVERVLALQRKLDSYENNKILGRETEALEALFDGVVRYRELEDVAELGIQGEVDAIYNQICGILLNNYGLKEEDVLTILAYDDATYSRVVYNLLSGADFVRPGEENAEELPAQNVFPEDVLPEEEEFIHMN